MNLEDITTENIQTKAEKKESMEENEQNFSNPCTSINWSNICVIRVPGEEKSK